MATSLSLLHRPCIIRTHTRTRTHTPNPSTLSLKPLSFSPLAPPPSKPPRLRNGVVTARMSSSSSSPQATERVISIAAYTLPFFNSLQYGRYILSQYPKIAILFDPVIPFLSLYRSIPYASFVAFFALYLGIVRNPNFSHFVRFNAMQAVTLDVLLVIPVLIHQILSPGRVGFGFRVSVWFHNAIFLFSLFCFVYSAVSCVLGRTPYLPFVADAANRQI